MHSTTSTLLLPLLPFLALTLAQDAKPSTPITKTKPTHSPVPSALIASYSKALADLASIKHAAQNEPLGKSVSAFYHTQTAIPSQTLIHEEISYAHAVATGATDPPMPFLTILPSSLQSYASAMYKSAAQVIQSEIEPEITAIRSAEGFPRTTVKAPKHSPTAVAAGGTTVSGGMVVGSASVGTGANSANGTVTSSSGVGSTLSTTTTGSTTAPASSSPAATAKGSGAGRLGLCVGGVLGAVGTAVVLLL